MRLVLTVVVMAMTCAQPVVMAQQAGENINVLPVVFPQEDPESWFLKGDGFLQRQVEPTIAASTRNPDHLLAFFVDYRAVDMADDIGLGETNTMVAMFNTTRTIMMATSGLSLPTLSRDGSPPIAAAEAWIGMSRSYDGGLTWSGGFLPGAPFDSGSSITTPVDGLQAASDPALVAGPCGKFYLAFMAFNRDGESKLVVARYQDLNSAGGGDTIVYQGMTVIDEGTNTKCNDYFLDKPDIEVDIFREPCGDLCADRVYVSYSTFLDEGEDGTFESLINVARSSDGGLTFRRRQVNRYYHQNQGSALTVDPANGTVYVFWRHFNDPDAILLAKSTSYGKWWSWPKTVTQHVPMAAFDQPTITAADAFAAGAMSPVNPGFPEIAFRSNGFPTAAVNSEGTIFAAWQERVGADGRPSETGTPRIVVVRSENSGRDWTDINGDPSRLAVDMGMRDVPGDPAIPEPGFGALPQHRYAGPQVQPKISISGSQFLLAYFESRGRIGNYGYSDPMTGEFITPSDVNTTGFISGYDRLLDFRAALLDPQSGALISTSQVSRYPIRADADLSDGEDLMDVAPVNWPCYPDSGDGTDPLCVRQVNRSGATQSAAGKVSFIGDYQDVAPVVQFVFDGTAWRWATEAEDVPYRGFHTIFNDNRHLLPPPGPDEWNGYQFYDPPWESPPNNLPGCTNPGSRNTDVLTARIDTSMVLSAPTTFKELDDKRSFPFSVKNSTGESRLYHLEITDGIGGASFHQFDDAIHGGDVEIFAYSSGSFMVYINTGYPDPVRVEVNEVCPPPPGFAYICTDSSGVLTFNVDSGYDQIPTVNGPDTQSPELAEDPFFVIAGDVGDPSNPFVINPFVINPFVINPFVINPHEQNPFVINPFVINPFVINPFVINTAPEDIEAVIDTTWTVSPGTSNTASSYLPLVNIDNAQAFIDAGYVFQLIVHKGSLYGGISGCNAVNVSQPQILANVYQDPGAENPFVINPFVINPFVINPFVINSSFTMAPADNIAVPDDGTTKAAPASNDISVTLRAFKLPPPVGQLAAAGDGGELKLATTVEYKPWEDPPSLVIVPQSCDPNDPNDPDCEVLSVSPDLIPLGVDTTPIVADAGRVLAGFPSNGWTLSNEGLPGQTVGDATAENGILRHGFYICDLDYVDTYPADVPLDVTDPLCTAISEFQASSSNTLALWDQEYFNPVDLSIPSITVGDYYLLLYADDTVQVSERTEINNWVAVLITIEDPNLPPDAEDTTGDTNEDTAVTGFLTATDPNGDPLTFIILTGPSNGDVAVSGDSFTYTPDEDFYGQDAFTFSADDGEFESDFATVTITVAAVNDAPSANDTSLTTDEDAAGDVPVSGTDVDDDPLSLAFALVDAPLHGSVVISASTFTYTPATDYNGLDTFTFAAIDAGGLTSGPATVTITVVPVNDPPTAADADLSTDEDAIGTVVVSGSDVDNDPLTLSFSLVGNPQHGLAELVGSTFTYTPIADYNGTDSFTFIANDGIDDSTIATVSITVAAVNDTPNAEPATFNPIEDIEFTGNLAATDVDGDPLTFSLVTGATNGIATISPDGSFTYLANPDYHGPDQFTFIANDGTEDSPAAAVSLSIGSTNDAPVASDGSATTPEDLSYSGNLSASDVDGDTLSYVLISGTASGVVSVGSNGAFSYLPNADFFGADSFEFRASDGSSSSDTAVMTITVVPVNDPPVAFDSSIQTDQNTAVSETLQGYDIDAGDVWAFSIESTPPSGVVTIDNSATGEFTYTPNDGFVGEDSFTFRITDQSGAFDSGSITIDVIDSVSDWDFVGFLWPWRPALEVEEGSTVPLIWYYTDPDTGWKVNSSAAEPEIRITRYSTCEPMGDPLEQWIEEPNFYFWKFWKLYWDTDGLEDGCYFFEIHHPHTGQTDNTSHRGSALMIEVDTTAWGE